jgi:predicted TPR repeat methyltransferase
MAAQVEEQTHPLAVQRVEVLRQGSAEFRRLEARYGAPGPALRHMGLGAWQAGDLSLAAELMQFALAHNPGDASVWRDLAFIFDAQGNLAGAREAILKALSYDDAHAPSWLILGRLHSVSAAPDDAEAAFRKALAIDPDFGEVHLALGFACVNALRFGEAVRHLEAAERLGAAGGEAQAVLGHLRFQSGDFAGAVRGFEAAIALGMTGIDLVERRARARAFLGMIGDAEAAVATYLEEAGDAQVPLSALLREAFVHLSAQGHAAAALRVGAWRLSLDPTDPEMAWLLAAQGDGAPGRAPDSYVEAYFDRFAPDFDQKLVHVLGYDGPARLSRMIGAVRPHFERILDLGCGTGLAATCLSAFGGRITGVDLSGRMLERAAARGLYANLVKSEAVRYLETSKGAWDLVLAADVLIYFGALEAVFTVAAAALDTGGVFAFSVETLPDEIQADFKVRPSGRFAHSPDYIARLAAGFETVAWEKATIRQEVQTPVAGLFVVLRKAAPF